MKIYRRRSADQTSNEAKVETHDPAYHEEWLHCRALKRTKGEAVWSKETVMETQVQYSPVISRSRRAGK